MLLYALPYKFQVTAKTISTKHYKIAKVAPSLIINNVPITFAKILDFEFFNLIIRHVEKNIYILALILHRGIGLLLLKFVLKL